MTQEIISFLNLRITQLGYFNDVFGLATRIEREGKIYPAIYNDNNEYTQINLDSKGSLTYWRRNGDNTYTEQENTSTIGNEYLTTIPLRLVGFLKKESVNDTYFSEKIVNTLIGILTTNSVTLKQAIKAKRISIAVKKYEVDGRILATEEYDKIDFEPRYDWAYFAIEFEVKVVTSTKCFDTFCDVPAPDFNCGVVKIYDTNGTLIDTIDCGDSYIVSATGDAIVQNTDNTFSHTIPCGTTYSLSDTTYEVYVNGVLNQTTTIPSMVDYTINITA